MSDPLVSVIMAVFNGERYLQLAIDSVLRQDYGAFELVIVDDASTDPTPEIIRSYEDPRIIYLRNESNQGQTKSLSIALARARGEFIARIDADDLYLPGKLRKQYVFMVAHPNVAVCGTWGIKIDLEGRQVGVHVTPTRPADIMFRILHGVPLCHVSVMMRRDEIVRHGGYQEHYRYAADFDLWARLIKDRCGVANLPEPLIEYREFPGSVGAINKIGAGGDEAAEIIEANARDLVGVALSREECRDIALLYFPASALGPARICRAYVNLKRLAKRSYGRTPLRVSVELVGMLFWSLVKARLSRGGKNSHAPPPRGVWATVGQLYRHPGVLAIAACSYACALIGERRLVKLKESFQRQVVR